jgi:hypothetical protein
LRSLPAFGLASTSTDHPPERDNPMSTQPYLLTEAVRAAIREKEAAARQRFGERQRLREATATSLLSLEFTTRPTLGAGDPPSVSPLLRSPEPTTPPNRTTFSPTLPQTTAVPVAVSLDFPQSPFNPTSPISTAQLERMAENRAKALERRACSTQLQAATRPGR